MNTHESCQVIHLAEFLSLEASASDGTRRKLNLS